MMETTYSSRSFGKMRGLVLRSELIVLLQHKIFSELYGEWEGKVDMSLFRMAYPRYPDISRIFVSTTEREYHVDLRPIMNTTPITCLHSTSLPQMFNLFRALGLRHMIVLNDNNEVNTDDDDDVDDDEYTIFHLLPRLLVLSQERTWQDSESNIQEDTWREKLFI